VNSWGRLSKKSECLCLPLSRPLARLRDRRPWGVALGWDDSTRHHGRADAPQTIGHSGANHLYRNRLRREGLKRDVRFLANNVRFPRTFAYRD
jgi:hypothetical protein